MMTPARVTEVPRERCIDPVELRRLCELDLLMPPSVAEAAECLAAWNACDPEWAEVWLETAIWERDAYLDSLFPRLREAFEPDDQDVIGRCALEARIESPCGPPPLVMTLAGWPADGRGTPACAPGSAVVVDFAGGAWHRFEAGTGARWSRRWNMLGARREVAHRCAPVRARRPWWRWWL